MAPPALISALLALMSAEKLQQTLSFLHSLWKVTQRLRATLPDRLYSYACHTPVQTKE